MQRQESQAYNIAAEIEDGATDERQADAAHMVRQRMRSPEQHDQLRTARGRQTPEITENRGPTEFLRTTTIVSGIIKGSEMH